MHKYKLVVSFLLLILLTACGGTGASVKLEGTSWALVEIAGQAVIPESNPTLVFEQDQVGGNGSCNSFGGGYQAEEGSLKFDALFSTLMACEDGQVMDQETAYLSALQEAASYELRDGELRIFDAAGTITLVFQANSQE